MFQINVGKFYAINQEEFQNLDVKYFSHTVAYLWSFVCMWSIVVEDKSKAYAQSSAYTENFEKISTTIVQSWLYKCSVEIFRGVT